MASIIWARRAPVSVEGAALDQGLDHAAVHPALVHLLAEIGKRRERSFGLAGLDHRFDGGDADVLDRGKAEADRADGAARLDVLAVVGLDDREIPAALVHVRRQDVDAHLAGLVDVLHHLVRVLDFAREQGGHVFHGVVGLEVRRLVGDEGVGRAVGLVEPVLGELGHEVEDRLGLLGSMPCSSRPSGTCSFCLAISSGFFLPMARRSRSARRANSRRGSRAICITCSWYTMTP